MPTFPTLSQDPDSTMYEVSQEDPAMRTEMEGGYVVTRPRHTRRPRKTFKIGFTRLTDADKLALENFWDEVKGGSHFFDWEDPPTGIEMTVRFKGEISFKYVGIGNIHHWDVRMILEQV